MTTRQDWTPERIKQALAREAEARGFAYADSFRFEIAAPSPQVGAAIADFLRDGYFERCAEAGGRLLLVKPYGEIGFRMASEPEAQALAYCEEAAYRRERVCQFNAREQFGREVVDAMIEARWLLVRTGQNMAKFLAISPRGRAALYRHRRTSQGEGEGEGGIASC